MTKYLILLLIFLSVINGCKKNINTNNLQTENSINTESNINADSIPPQITEKVEEVQSPSVDIFEASMRGNILEVKEFLKNGDDINSKMDVYLRGDVTPIVFAAGGGNTELVKYFIDEGADLSLMKITDWAKAGFLDKVKECLVNGVDIDTVSGDEEYGGTSLMFAIEHEQLDIVKYLIDEGADINYDYIEPSILIAASKSNLEVIKLLVEQGGVIIDQTGRYNTTALAVSASKGDLEIVKYLVDNGADINAYDNVNPLTEASSNNHLEVVKYLVDQGAVININNSSKGVALQKSLSNGHLDIAEYLLDKGADINAQGYGKDTALIIASREGNFDMVRFLVDRGADVNINDNDGITAMFEAYSSGHYDILKYLIKKGANIHARKSMEATLLILISQKDNVTEDDYEVVDILIKSDINLDTNYKGETALMFASEKGNLKLVELLIKSGAGINILDRNNSNAFLKAFDGEHKEVMTILVKSGADVDSKKLQLMSKPTALREASSAGNFELVRLLIDLGADVKADNSHSLMLASSTGNIDIINLLIKLGSDINIKDQDGYSLIRNATDRGKVEVVKTLISHGADIHERNKYDQSTLLINASEDNYIDVVKLLIDKGADLNAKDKKGETALLKAVDEDHYEVMKVLVGAGANIDTPNSLGDTALMLAISNNLESVKFLVEKGADINIKNSYNRTALNIAERKKKEDIVEYLKSIK